MQDLAHRQKDSLSSGRGALGTPPLEDSSKTVSVSDKARGGPKDEGEYAAASYPKGPKDPIIRYSGLG